MKIKKKKSIAGMIIVGLFLLVEIAFMGLLFYTRMVPGKFLMGIGACFLILAVFVGILTHNVRKRGRFLLGTILAFAVTVVLVLGGMYIYQTTSALSDISGINTEVAQVGIYVRTEDKAETVLDIKDYTLGVLTELDRENTDKVLEELNEEFGNAVKTQEYQGLTELIDGLVNEETGAIVLNQAYLSVLEEMEGYLELSSMIREVSVKNVETVIEEKENTAVEGQNPIHGEGGIYTVYVSGIDNRGELIAKSRSDVNIIAVANTNTKQLLLVSTPRDYFVPLSISNGIPDKLTHAGIYGVNVSMDTLGMLYETDVNDYFRLNFGGFKDIIDALGGITVMSDYDFSAGSYHFNKGENTLSGEEALAFARERYAFKEGDRQRGKNQMAVIKGVINKALSPELLKKYSSVLSSLEGSFETSFSYEEIGSLVQQQLTNGGTWNVVSYSVNGTGDSQKPYSMSQRAYVMVPDYKTVDKAKELMQKVRDGEIISQE